MLKPRKKLNIFIAIFILLFGIAIGGYLVLKSHSGQAGQIASILNGQTTFACQPDANNSNKDSDNDGLKDWQEIQIYRTNPCEDDTDNDGYLDGEEAAAGYDPLIKAPNDKISNKALDPRPAAGTLTGQLAAKIVEKMMSSQLSDATGAVDESQIDSFVNESFDSMIDSVGAGSYIVSVDSISDKEIIISGDNSDEARAKYLLRTTDMILGRFGGQTNESDGGESRENFAIATRAMKSRDFTELDDLIQTYRDSAEMLKQIVVPSSKKAFHKTLIAYLLSCANIFETVKSIDDDPLKVVLALRQYEDLVKQTFEPIMK